ncbi:Lpg0189 family type II secretion system effector [Legionella jordanis]|uniref:Uncharacterized protein n=1 Tax=Legionella jordanis TaxID=456 RepID=A0A0W0VB31_9GAMM|nr:Lpg0189 family type II secretion system effector [Legionella jordanis]KTD17295.1 hypothetical protein Ljor_1601 [Legionella jordanis]RMW99461.1 hypothetical protein EAW55_13735 [Legionella jordanis]RMX15310.1 hypothetical protein EAS68_12580 [Legionella jordanis]VEH12506.1 Uncharacterised protein [Legionella jordanis]HAT8715232.1 hypothetical protein [Legionella jordanis]
MKQLLSAFLFVCSLAACAESSHIYSQEISSSKYKIIKKDSNLQTIIKHPEMFTRTHEYPTQIVRIHGKLNNSTLNCDEVAKTIDDFFSKAIKHDLFYYNTLIICGYDPKTDYAISYNLQSYFDPLNDAAIDYLQTYLKEHNGKLLLGKTFFVENAEGVVISLNIHVGNKNAPSEQSMLLLRTDNSNHYFANNYQVMKELMADIKERYNSNDPELILPFLSKWFYPSAGMFYQRLLKLSNYTELLPERIFLMEQEPKIFSSALKFYFANYCSKYPNKHCL